MEGRLHPGELCLDSVMGFFFSLNYSYGFHYHLYLLVSHIGQGG